MTERSPTFMEYITLSVKTALLIGKSLLTKHGGTYQCFVKDKETGVEVFSRKLKVNVTGKLLFNTIA